MVNFEEKFVFTQTLKLYIFRLEFRSSNALFLFLKRREMSDESLYCVAKHIVDHARLCER